MPSAERQLEAFIAKFAPETAARAREVLAKMRKVVPGATNAVYDNYNALAIAFGPTEKVSDAVFSIAVYPRWVSLFIVGGPKLHDPDKLLQGSGSVVRHIRLDDGAATLDRPAVRALMAAAMRLARPPIDPRATPRIVIKSISAKQRPRRSPAAKPKPKAKAKAKARR